MPSPKPGMNSNWARNKKGKPVTGRPVVDPRPGKGTPIKAPKAKGPTVNPLPISGDDKIIRTMPITEKQLGQIKKYYGIK